MTGLICPVCGHELRSFNWSMSVADVRRGNPEFVWDIEDDRALVCGRCVSGMIDARSRQERER